MSAKEKLLFVLFAMAVMGSVLLAPDRRTGLAIASALVGGMLFTIMTWVWDESDKEE